MKNIITALGTTAKGSSKFKLSHKQSFFQQLAEFNGAIKVTIELIEDDATEQQKCYFRAEVVNVFRRLSQQEQSHRMSEQEAEAFLIQRASLEGHKCDNLSKSEMSKLIDESKRFLREFFSIELS